MYHLKKSPNSETINEIAIETGIAPAFIEKDWFAVQLIALIAENNKNEETQAVFSGGTSLSKGYNLIQRFSEDLDFFLCSFDEGEPSQSKRRSFRKRLINFIVSSDDRFKINEDDIKRGNEHRFFKAPLLYQKVFDKEFLRPHLQLEMTFAEPRIKPEKRKITSIVDSFLKQEISVEILCLSPLETAGDKLSAFSWRVLVRNRDDANDDPAIVRHLHDLASLESLIIKDKMLFKEVAKTSLTKDRNRRGGEKISNLSDLDRLQKAYELIKTDSAYKKEYENFVLAMSYAPDDKIIHFEEACLKFENIINLYLG